MIKALSSARASDRPPSYIDAITFTTALLGSSFEGATLSPRFVRDAEVVNSKIGAIETASKEPVDVLLRSTWAPSDRDPATFVATLMNDTDHGIDAVARLLPDEATLSAQVTVSRRSRRVDPAR